MPPKSSDKGVKSRKSLNDDEVRLLVKAVGVLSGFAEKFGVAFAVFVILLFAIWSMGTAQTKDDFLRELLFGSVTKTRYISVFFCVLVLIAVFGLDTKMRSYRTENKEMKRLADERTLWEQRALGTSLSHTVEEVES